MNRRQAKKAFKKKYGITPLQAYESALAVIDSFNSVDWDAVWHGIAKTLDQITNDILKEVKQDGESEHDEGNADNQQV